MMPVVRIPDSVYERLQKHATPFVDTPATVIERLLDSYERQSAPNPGRASPKPAMATPIKSFDPETPPDLQHTRILSAEISGEQATKWNDLVAAAHRCALAKLGSFDALKEASRSNIVKGRKEDDGFHHHRELSISIQYVGSNQAWKNSFLLARRLGLPIRVTFQWRDKAGSAHPGETGSLSWEPSKA